MPYSLNRRDFMGMTVMASLTACGGGPAPEQTAEAKYQPNWESLQAHIAPPWFNDAKLGIFVHWGLYSVPAWATPVGELGKIDWNVWFKNNPYAEWYLNSLRIDGSPTQKHHYETYGKDFGYMDFVPTFNEAVQSWDPATMAGVFADTGARYVVLTSKHHDGFTLWPSEVNNPHLPPEKQHASRDIVGDLTKAVHNAGMKMGLYYSGGLDWSFNPTPIETREQVRSTINHTEEFANYADAHWRELIAKYEPIVLWNDIGYPKQAHLAEIIADYYNRFPDGLMNNRFETGIEGDPPRHHDFVTPEYAKMDEITDYKWESCRGLGYSFGYNQVETEKQIIGEDELIHLLTDIVSKNGNLLLNVGPKADGSIAELQLARLKTLGEWLGVNGEAIFDTKPWERAEGQTSDGTDVRFTSKDGAVYAVVLADLKGGSVTINDAPGAGAKVSLLGGGELKHTAADGKLTVELPSGAAQPHAYALKIA